MDGQIAGRQRRRLVDVGYRQGIDRGRLGIADGEVAQRIDNQIGVVAIGIGFDHGADFHLRRDGFADEADIVKNRRAGNQTTRLAQGMLRVHAISQ